MIMNKLLDEIKKLESDNPSVITYIGASKVKEDFYEKFDFVKRLDAGLGAGMILKKYN